MVSLKRTALHKTIGVYGYILAVLMFFSAIALTIEKNRIRFDSGHPEEIRFMIVPFMVITRFFSLITVAVIFRKTSAIHRRLLLLAIIELMAAPLARIIGPIIGSMVPARILGFMLEIYGAEYALILVAMGYDLVTRGKVHRIYWVAVPLLISAHFLMSVIYNHSYWLTISKLIIGR